MLNIIQSETDPKHMPEIVSFKSFLLILIGVVLGVAIAVIILPTVLPDLYASLIGNDPKAFWFLARGSAVAAYITLWLAMVLGLTMTTKTARFWPGGAEAYDIHQFISLLGIGFAVFHAMILLGDQYIGFNLFNLMIPFANSVYRPLWVGAGQVALYLWVLIAISFYFRKLITVRAWRLIHYLGFLLYVLALFHGIMSGTDSGQLWGALLYWISGGIFLCMFIFRLLLKGQTRIIHKSIQRGDAKMPNNM